MSFLKFCPQLILKAKLLEYKGLSKINICVCIHIHCECKTISFCNLTFFVVVTPKWSFRPKDQGIFSKLTAKLHVV